ncbi:MAG: hypothetical protein IPI81_15745 [Flavobacteriales bacterium]|nr:hypothetical protein [Flavobacteriales bacterium]MCC6936601.1 hypothetical protein [Flavobacteriales bacterium]
MFEHRSRPLISQRRFAGRLLKYLGYALLLVGLSLALGVWGYMEFGHLRFVDAFLNASMILGGMGPVDVLTTDPAKYFAAFYALYSGITLLGAVAVFLTPVLHRMLHILHLDDNKRGD